MKSDTCAIKWLNREHRDRARKPEMTAYQVERLSEDRSFWNRIGGAWLCKDGSYNIKLFALPTSGEFNLRPRKEEEEQ